MDLVSPITRYEEPAANRYRIVDNVFRDNPKADVREKSNIVAPDDFARFLAWLDADPQRAADVYNAFQRRLTIYFAARGCGSWAGDLASQTLDRTAAKFSNGNTIDDREPGKYIFRVAGFVLLEHCRRPQPGALETDIPVVPPPADERIELLCCKQCLEQLSQAERDLLEEYYEGEKKGEAKRLRAGAASSLGLAQGTLRVRAFRLKKRLLECTTACVQSHPRPVM